jgi:hypothetical protein
MPGRAYEAGSIPVPDYLTGYWSGAVRFVPPNELVASPILRVPAPDPVGAVRRAIRDGRAHAEDRTELNGRAVEHIRFDPCRSHNSPCGPGADAYVDPGTFYPVEIDLPARRGLPRDVTRFTAFEYLPRTAANLALTSIRAQHPHASRPVCPAP